MVALGIIGMGFVGNALFHGMKHAHRIETYDKFNEKKSTVQDIEELVDKCSIIFVCVPTPMKENGSCDTSIVSSVVFEIESLAKEKEKTPIIVIKSTVSPGTTGHLNCVCQKSEVMFNPEFLREISPVEDFKNQTRIVLGGSVFAVNMLEEIYKMAYPDVPILKTDSATAEMVKYTTNCFLATKVSFANEIFQICDKLHVKYDEMIDIAKHDERLGDSHWMVPGPMPDPEGNLKPGFSGSCFCKDLNALIYSSEKLNVDPKVMKAAWDKNLEVRPEKDWERLIGRAVVKK